MNKLFSMLLIVIGMTLSAHADLFPTPPNQQPPPGPGWNDIYGPPRTVRWQDLGSFQAEKFIDMNVDINVRDQFVNEVFLAAQDNQVEIKQAVAYLSNGQTFEMRNMEGVIQRDRQYRVQLDYRNSLRIRRLVFTIRSPNLMGSRATFLMQLGLAY